MHAAAKVHLLQADWPLLQPHTVYECLPRALLYMCPSSAQAHLEAMLVSTQHVPREEQHD